MIASTLQEEVKLEAMQRLWQPSRRSGSASSFFEENIDLQELLTSSQNPRNATINKGHCVPSPINPCSDLESDDEFLDVGQVFAEQKQDFQQTKSARCLLLDASELGDLPARYVIHPVHSHQFPAVGVYLDKRVVPGFKYRVKPLPGVNQKVFKQTCLFGGRALTLQSIGRGYSRRFTFEADENCLNDNENYFWSDNRPEGYAFELSVIGDGDKFTIFDVNREAQGTVEIMKVEGNQIEIGCCVSSEGVEKKVKVKLIAKVEFYEIGVSQMIPISGVVICVKNKTQPKAEIKKVINVNIRHHRYYLTPGYQKNCRRVTVRGLDIGDIPTKYTMTGLEPYEIPVVGTYVDPRILPGFHYRVRPNHRKEHLFDGRSLKLLSIGIGYAKRLTFEPDSLVTPDNYLWSDNHPDGLGLEPRALHKNMKFTIIGDGNKLGEAKVFRVDMPQFEEHMEKELTPSGKYAVVKYIHVDVMCHVKLEINGSSSHDNEHLMRVCGLAIVRKESNSIEARVVRVENVGLDSQLNLLFARTHTELTFVPLY